MNPYITPPAKQASPKALPSPPILSNDNFNIKNFKKDDWILLSVIAILLFEGCTDYILLCALGYLFFIGI